jgi:hypothetical protein
MKDRRGVVALVAMVVLGCTSVPASASPTHCVEDEVVGTKEPVIGARAPVEQPTIINTRDHRVLRFDIALEAATAATWKLTTAIRICRTDIAGIYAVVDMAFVNYADLTAHGKIIRGAKP